MTNELPYKFAVNVKECQDIQANFDMSNFLISKTAHVLPTMYWLHKLHKIPYKARFIANSSSCTTTELSKLLFSWLTVVQSCVIRYYETMYERSRKNMLWSIKYLARY